MKITAPNITPGDWFKSNGRTATVYASLNQKPAVEVCKAQASGISPVESVANARFLAASRKMAETLQAIYNATWDREALRKPFSLLTDFRAAAQSALESAGYTFTDS